MARTDMEQVAEYERIKQDLLRKFERSLHTHVLNDDMRELRALLKTTAAWIGVLKPSPSGLVRTIVDERKVCSAAQRGLLNMQQRKLVELGQLARHAVADLDAHRLDSEHLESTGVLARINQLVEEIVLNSSEIVAVPTGKKAA